MTTYETVAAMGDENKGVKATSATYRTIDLPDTYSGKDVIEALATGIEATDGITYRLEAGEITVTPADGINRVIPATYSTELQADVEPDRRYGQITFDELPGRGSIEEDTFNELEETVVERLEP